MRLDEFQIMSKKEWYGLSLKAWARYRRGDMPEHEEVDSIMRRVESSHPKAEFVGMRRTLVPTCEDANNTEVWWELEWMQFGE